MLEHIKTTTIIGTGLLGASVGLALKSLGYRGTILGMSRQEKTAQRACELGCVDAVCLDPAEAVGLSDLLIVAVPLSAFQTVFAQMAPHLRQSAIVTDVGSTKQSVMELARKFLPYPARFVPSHPMAGSEQQGPEHARADLFDDKPCIVTPDERTDVAALEMVESLWQSMGMRVMRLSAADHDHQAAVISHLPHAMAVMLVRVAGELGGLDLASTGFRDTTRLASSNPPMRADIMMSNRVALGEALKALRRQIDQLEAHLQVADQDNLLMSLNEAKHARDIWMEAKDE